MPKSIEQLEQQLKEQRYFSEELQRQIEELKKKIEELSRKQIEPVEKEKFKDIEQDSWRKIENLKVKNVSQIFPLSDIEFSDNIRITKNSDYPVLNLYCYAGSSGAYPSHFFARARGTKENPTIVANGDTIGKFEFRAYDGYWFCNGAYLWVVVDGTPTPGTPTSWGRVPTRIGLMSTDTSGETNWAFFVRHLNLEIGEVNSNGKWVLAIKNGTPPTSSPADSVQIYAQDVGGSSELKVRDEAGNITILS